MGEDYDLHTIAYRLGETERRAKELRSEMLECFSETRVAADAVNRELRSMIREDYLTKADARVEYIGRGEPHRAAAGRREWLLVVAALAASFAAVVQLVILTVGH